MANYPKRERFFAHRVVRLALKTCLAQTAGLDGLALLTAIAHTEDAKRYTGPVTYYNDQLQSLLAFKKWKRLDRARQVLVQEGWLHYEPPPRGHRRAPLYWCLVPARLADLDDSPTDEGVEASYGYQEGYKAGYADGKRHSTRKRGKFAVYPLEGVPAPGGYPSEGHTEGHTEGYAEGELSNLTRTRTQKKAPPRAASLPEELRGEGFAEAWRRWIAHRAEIRKPLTPTCVDRQLARLAALGQARAVAMIDYTIAQGWQGLREEEPGRGNGRPAKSAAVAHEEHAKAVAEQARRRQESAERIARRKAGLEE